MDNDELKRERRILISRKFYVRRSELRKARDLSRKMKQTEDSSGIRASLIGELIEVTNEVVIEEAYELRREDPPRKQKKEWKKAVLSAVGSASFGAASIIGNVNFVGLSIGGTSIALGGAALHQAIRDVAELLSR